MTVPRTSLRTSFLPSRHGFPFPNSWRNSMVRLTIGRRPFSIGLLGRCGGMAFAALDYHRLGHGALAHGGPELPEPGSPLARYIVRRQVESLAGGLGTNMRRFVAWTLSPSGSRWGTLEYTRRSEAGKVLVAMVAHNPVPLGLLTNEPLAGLGLNHQVVAYGTDSDHRELRVHVYDPNYPLRDDVTIVVPWKGGEPFVEYVGAAPRREWRGLFVERYVSRMPPA